MGNRVIFLIGLPGSAKSTWAKSMLQRYPNEYKRWNNDDARVLLDCGKWSEANEKFLLKIRDKTILEALDSGKSIIIDNTHCSLKHLNHIQQLLRARAPLEVVFFDVSPETCIKRDSQREAMVGKDVIDRMTPGFYSIKEKLDSFKCKVTIITEAEQEQERKPEEIDVALAPLYTEGNPSAAIFDVDGTLAFFNGRGPFEYHKCNTDLVNEPVADLARRYHKDGIKIIIMSGRDSSCKELTEQWLKDNSIPFDNIFMRSHGDVRKDTIVKRELFDNNVRGKYNVMVAIDDRNQICQLWRRIGLVCWQVNEGSF